MLARGFCVLLLAALSLALTLAESQSNAQRKIPASDGGPLNKDEGDDKPPASKGSTKKSSGKPTSKVSNGGGAKVTNSARPSLRPTIKPSAKPSSVKKVDQKGGVSGSKAKTKEEDLHDGRASEIKETERGDSNAEHTAISQGSTESRTQQKRNATASLRIAYCLTGQLARLELHSKIQNIFIPNARAGHHAHIFVFLDRDVGIVKQTYWNYNYSKSVFGGYNRRDIKALLDDASDKAGVLKAVRSRVKLEVPSRSHFAPVHGIVPVKDKTFTGHDGPRDNFESAASRFQNNMRWMNGLRDCVKWVMETEFTQGWHYDLVVRLRDDTYALGPWVLDHTYLNALTSSNSGNFRGINDHNFVIARKWADVLFRGLTEDYYFNSSQEKVIWGNPETRIRQMTEVYNIPVKEKNICQQPLIPLRGLVNESYWYVHPLFIRHFFHDCIRLDEKGRIRPGSEANDWEEKYEDNPLPSCCRQEWMTRVHDRAVLALPPPKTRIYGNNPPVIHDEDQYEPPEYRRRE